MISTRKLYFAATVTVAAIAIFSIYTYEVQMAQAGITNCHLCFSGIFSALIAASITTAIVTPITDAQNAHEANFFANTTHGFAAINNQIKKNTALLEDSDFGLDAKINDGVYGQKRIASDIQHSDFGLDAEVNDPIYGQKRIAADIQDSDFGVEMIDDETELIDMKIVKQVVKQRVAISIIKSENDIFLQTSEFGTPVNVQFEPAILLIDDDALVLTNEQFEFIQISEGLYQFENHFNGDYDGVFIQATHIEDPIIHHSLAEPIPADHFGSLIISPNIDKTAG